jgi:hypothetical protein
MPNNERKLICLTENCSYDWVLQRRWNPKLQLDLGAAASMAPKTAAMIGCCSDNGIQNCSYDWLLQRQWHPKLQL